MYLPRSIRAAMTVGLVAAAWMAAGGLRAAEPPVPPARADLERAIAAARTAGAVETPVRPLTILLLKGPKDHGRDEHDYPRWQARWALLLGGKDASDEKAANLFGPDRHDAAVDEGAAGVRVTGAEDWPKPDQWNAADLVVAFCYLEWNPSRLEELGKFLGRGGGLVLIHSATWTRPEPSPEVARLVGVGGFRRWRHGSLLLEIAMAGHPVCRGLPEKVQWVDEPYWPPTPPVGEQIAVLAGSREETEPGKGNVSLQPQFWAYRQGKGRVFGCVPGHYTWTFDDPYFRLLLLRGMAWAAGEHPYRFDELALRCAAVAEGHE